jgi:hypothetical protein
MKSGFDLYTRLVEDNGTGFGIQCLPLEENKDMVIPVGLESSDEGSVTLSAEMNNLPSGCQVMLEDRQAGTFTQLTPSSSFTLQVVANSNIEGRFFLHTLYGTNGIANIANDWKVYTTKGQIIISGTVTGQATATLYNVLGSKIREDNLREGSLNTIPSSCIRNGIYLLKINDQGGIFTRKIAIDN